eukprot:745820-Hanusia_phi.AAC.1
MMKTIRTRMKSLPSSTERIHSHAAAASLPTCLDRKMFSTCHEGCDKRLKTSDWNREDLVSARSKRDSDMNARLQRRCVDSSIECVSVRTSLGEFELPPGLVSEVIRVSSALHIQQSRAGSSHWVTAALHAMFAAACGETLRKGIRRSLEVRWEVSSSCWQLRLAYEYMKVAIDCTSRLTVGNE